MSLDNETNNNQWREDITRPARGCYNCKHCIKTIGDDCTKSGTYCDLEVEWQANEQETEKANADYAERKVVDPGSSGPRSAQPFRYCDKNFSGWEASE